MAPSGADADRAPQSPAAQARPRFQPERISGLCASGNLTRQSSPALAPVDENPPAISARGTGSAPLLGRCLRLRRGLAAPATAPVGEPGERRRVVGTIRRRRPGPPGSRRPARRSARAPASILPFVPARHRLPGRGGHSRGSFACPYEHRKRAPVASASTAGRCPGRLAIERCRVLRPLAAESTTASARGRP